MNIFVILILASLYEMPELPRFARADRRAARNAAIKHNHDVFENVVGFHIWFQHPNDDGEYTSYHSGQKTKKKQQGRWETNYLKTRSYIDTGRVHNGDKKRKGKRPYIEEIKCKSWNRANKRIESDERRKSIEFARFLIKQEASANEADNILAERDGKTNASYSLYNKCLDYDCVPYIDCNHPGILYMVDAEIVKKFVDHMKEDGACIFVSTSAINQYEGTCAVVHVKGVFHTTEKWGLDIDEATEYVGV